MERFDTNKLAEFVGIYAPWSIKSFDIDDEKKILTLNLTSDNRGKVFSLLGGGKSVGKAESDVSGNWHHVRIGVYRAVIHAALPADFQSGDGDLGRPILELPHFLGSSMRPYSNYLRQSVALARVKGVDDGAIEDCFGLSSSVVKAILHDIDGAEPESSNLLYLPTEVDPVWQNVLQDKIHIKTNVLPLKFLLSKLKLASSKNDGENLMESCLELRKFFIMNAQRMNDEIGQLCGLTVEKARRQVEADKKRQRLVLPATNNPLWIDLLTGKLSLNSQSIPLRLLISRQRNVFLQASDNVGKVEVIETLRDYFKKNCRLLKPELVLINRALAIKKNTKFGLPDPSHAIWQKILNDDQLVPSDHMAYKLLLSKLRSQLVKNTDPVQTIEAARNIRSFIAQNQKTMRNELVVILKKANVI